MGNSTFEDVFALAVFCCCGAGKEFAIVHAEGFKQSTFHCGGTFCDVRQPGLVGRDFFCHERLQKVKSDRPVAGVDIHRECRLYVTRV